MSRTMIAAQVPNRRTIITSEMIEAAARAIREQACGRSGFTGYRRPRPWDALPQSLRESYRREASAALAAALDVNFKP